MPAGAGARISVICTAKNAAATINRTLASVRAQTFPDWEMVVVDDGSGDATPAIVAAAAEQDPRIRLVRTDGVGRGRALNLALASSRAALVANLDADDESHPQRLACQLDALGRRPEFAVLGTEYLQLRDAGAPAWPPLAPGAEVIDVTRALARANPICHSSVLMRRTTLLALGGYGEALGNNFDYDLWVRFAAAGHRLGRLALPLAAKRIHTGQVFLYGRRLSYAATSVQVQARAMRALGLTRRYWPLLPLRFVWGLLPPGLRFGLRRFGS